MFLSKIDANSKTDCREQSGVVGRVKFVSTREAQVSSRGGHRGGSREYDAYVSYLFPNVAESDLALDAVSHDPQLPPDDSIPIICESVMYDSISRGRFIQYTSIFGTS